jgi:hypothetical protein
MNLQQFQNGFHLQDKLFCQCVIIMEFISDDLWGFVNCYISKSTEKAKIIKESRDWMFKDFDKCTNSPVFFTNDSDFPEKDLKILLRKPAKLWANKKINLSL